MNTYTYPSECDPIEHEGHCISIVVWPLRSAWLWEFAIDGEPPRETTGPGCKTRRAAEREALLAAQSEIDRRKAA